MPVYVSTKTGILSLDLPIKLLSSKDRRQDKRYKECDKCIDRCSDKDCRGKVS